MCLLAILGGWGSLVCGFYFWSSVVFDFVGDDDACCFLFSVLLLLPPLDVLLSFFSTSSLPSTFASFCATRHVCCTFLGRRALGEGGELLLPVVSQFHTFLVRTNCSHRATLNRCVGVALKVCFPFLLFFYSCRLFSRKKIRCSRSNGRQK